MKGIATDVYRWLCERLYNELAGVYDPISALVSLGRLDQWRNVALDLLGQEQGWILELGFGTGVLLARLEEHYDFAVGVERSPTMIHTSLSRRRNGVPHRRVRGVAQALPFPDHQFGTIVSTFPAPYILDPFTLQECRRVLQPRDGRLIIVGLWVRPEEHTLIWRLEKFIPFFYGAPDASARHALSSRITDQGFQAKMYEELLQGVHVGIVVARPIAEL